MTVQLHIYINWLLCYIYIISAYFGLILQSYLYLVNFSPGEDLHCRFEALKIK